MALGGSALDMAHPHSLHQSQGLRTLSLQPSNSSLDVPNFVLTPGPSNISPGPSLSLATIVTEYDTVRAA